MNNMQAYQALRKKILADCDASTNKNLASILQNSIKTLDQTNQALLTTLGTGKVDLGLANASLYLDVFSRVVVAWVWLKQANIASQKLEQSDLNDKDTLFYQGKLQAAKYYIKWELPEIEHPCSLLQNIDSTCFDMQDAWF